ncbi:nicotinate-nucleotide adenylyltransferase [Mangrovimicrobium sediminis]|uniref:Probable nicotinate-nucleotide adenylyltransferase n=1 Tax=Mangrovimicrobium sediminis TaxID=2562682 RepID=A0A4Z0M462_9GAMM|nr:nicotinate-nucleotide adenylyltransferase [Haliea sp. SAOS-164]TGD74246.1 nicotinate-nucleotide adenylyltransferase [Haliea sp. SAOS-164]
MSDALAPVGVFGGTFDPVHYGHLRSALELVEHLGLEHLRLMPCAQHPHAKTPMSPAAHRAAMVELAVRDEPRLRCDTRELQRSGTSYTVLSLEELRAELGERRPLCLVMGGDAIAHIHSWHRWEAFLELAHIVVLARPGWHIPGAGEVADWLRDHRLADAGGLTRAPAGGILVEALRPLAISSTEIRAMLARGESPRYLLPEQVLDYIQEHKLYS